MVYRLRVRLHPVMCPPQLVRTYMEHFSIRIWSETFRCKLLRENSNDKINLRYYQTNINYSKWITLCQSKTLTKILMCQRSNITVRKDGSLPASSQGNLVRQCTDSMLVDMDFLWLPSARISSNGIHHSSANECKSI